MSWFGGVPDSRLPNYPTEIKGIFGNPVSRPGPDRDTNFLYKYIMIHEHGFGGAKHVIS
jgi:hypothetical protein